MSNCKISFLLVLSFCFLLGMATKAEVENLEKEAKPVSTAIEGGKDFGGEETPLISGITGEWTQDEINYFQNKEYVGDKRLYAEEDLIPPYIGGQATKEEELRYLRLLRNELFARDGFKFVSEDLKGFFDKMSWYKPLYPSVVVNEIAGDNARLIRKKEINLKAQGKEEVLSKGYVKTVVETTMGYGPEGFGFRMWEGDPDYPISIVADSRMRIYVLDHLNNRIRVYGDDGAHLRDIKVNVYEEASLEEMENEMGGLAFPKLYGKEMFIENDTIYIPVKKRFSGSLSLFKTLKVYPENHSNWEVEEIKSKELTRGDKFNAKISKVSGIEAEVTLNRQLIIRDIKKRSEKVIELSKGMKKVYIDKENNIYTTNLNSDINDYPQSYSLVQKYSDEGIMIRELKIPFPLDCPFVDKNGNIFAMQRVPKRINHPEVISPLDKVKITVWR